MKTPFKKFGITFGKIIGVIWCITFAIYWCISVMKIREMELPQYLDKYYNWYDNFLDNYLSGSLFALIFGIAFIVFFLWVVRRSNKDMGWDELSQIYSLSMDEVKGLNATFISGQSDMNDIYYNGIHVAFISTGIILRHPFPFNYLKPALLIPWGEMDKIIIKRGLRRDDQKNKFKIILYQISPWKYADVKLTNFKNQTIIVPWKNKLVKSLPEQAKALIYT